MRFITVILFALYVSSTIDAKSSKKFKDDPSTPIKKKSLVKSKEPPPAIIAIEIVDPNENKTSSKNSKRTIDGSLGYGYQSPPKYQVYKYSQRDIPSYQNSHSLFRGGNSGQRYNIQQSISYNLPSTNLNQYYQPGTTLYSTVNNAGHVGGLSSYLPQHSQEPQVPVIILRVYPNQLSDASALHANLPRTHPLASVVNSIDIQSLLAGHLQNLLLNQQQQTQQYYQPQYQQNYQYVDQQQPDYQSYQQEQQLQTHENYPKETHTRVIFRNDKSNEATHQNDAKTIQVSIPEQSYSMVQVQTPHMQYTYESPGSGQNYYYQQQQPEQTQYYYDQPAADSGYQSVEQQQVNYAPPVQNVQDDAPYNYHAHHKRSKKTRLSTIKQQEDKDEIVLDPIK